jgi:hypothetical protein
VSFACRPAARSSPYERRAVIRPAVAVASALSDMTDQLASQGRLPDFFIVGQQKSGTTALFEMLRVHPQIYMPDRKEPRFFATEMYERDAPRPGGTPRTLEEYRSWFAGAGEDQVVGEASAVYLWSRAAAEGIARVAPDARIIAIFREPASMLHSLHLQLVQTHVETETDLRTALALEQSRREGRNIPRHTYWPAMLLYSEHVRYADQLRRYAAVFPPEQLLVLIYDDFKRDNEGTIRAILRFLNVDDSLPVGTSEANPSVRVRSQRAQRLLHTVGVGRGPVSRTVKEAIKAVTPRRMRYAAWKEAQRRFVYAPPDPPDEELMSDMRARFRPEVVALGEFLGRDLVTLWGYDDAG